jgi:hypothetical protein
VGFGGPWTGDQKGSRVVRGKRFVGKNFAKNFGGRELRIRGGWAGRDPRRKRGDGGHYQGLKFLCLIKNLRAKRLAFLGGLPEDTCVARRVT